MIEYESVGKFTECVKMWKITLKWLRKRRDGNLFKLAPYSEGVSACATYLTYTWAFLVFRLLTHRNAYATDLLQITRSSLSLMWERTAA